MERQYQIRSDLCLGVNIDPEKDLRTSIDSRLGRGLLGILCQLCK